MMHAVVYEHVSCGSGSVPFSCFACGGSFSVRTGDFQRCTSCRAENYCPQTNVTVEERVRRWFDSRRVTSVPCTGAAQTRARR